LYFKTQWFCILTLLPSSSISPQRNNQLLFDRKETVEDGKAFLNVTKSTSVKPVLHPAVRAVYGLKLAKSQGTRKAHVRCSYPADHTKRPAEEFWHVHNFLRAPCDFRFAVSQQRTCTKKERYPCDLLAHVASLKWGVKGEKWHLNKYGTRTCVSISTCVAHVKYVSSEYNLRDTCLSSACAAWLARGTHGARTRSTPHGTSTCLLRLVVLTLGVPWHNN
jgi:hypothetical protein